NQGQLTAEQAAEFMLGLLAAHTPFELAAWHEEFMAQVVRPDITPQAVRLVDQHLAAGDLCALVTATNSFVTAPIARAFGLPHLIATIPEYRDGRYTCRIHGTPSFKEGEIVRVNQWRGDMGLTLAEFSESFCYRHSTNDVSVPRTATR